MRIFIQPSDNRILQFISIGGLVLTHIVLFSSSYFHLFEPNIWIFGSSYFLLTFLLGLSFLFNIYQKAFVIFLLFIVNCALGIGLVFSTMYIPGSKEHNYVMYNICFPLIQKDYEQKSGLKWPPAEEELDKEGFGKWWYRHSECEQNVYNGKGPVFSEDPPGFVPSEKSQTNTNFGD